MKKYQVLIGGRAYSVISDESEELINASALLVDSLIDASTSDRGAILTSLRLACQLKALEYRIEEYHIRDKRLIDVIDQENRRSELF
ncbi:MAG: hypothetical protein WC707_02160 [Candidatus Babeliaceae bacterium]